MSEYTIAEQLAAATEHIKANRLPEAESLCRKLLQAAPQLAEAYRLLGIVAYLGRRFDHAVALFGQAIMLDPRVAESYDNRCLALHELGRDAEAETDGRRALSLKPFAGAYNNLGIVLQALRRPEEALELHQKAIAINPGFAEAHHSLAAALAALGRFDEAEAAYGRALSMQPHFPEALNGLGLRFHAHQRWDEAASMFRRALAQRPGFVDAENNLGLTLKRQGKGSEAVDAFRRALAITPERADLHNNLGTTLLAQGLLDEADAEFGRALELRPDLAAAHANRLLCQQYRSGVTRAALRVTHEEYDRQHALPLRVLWQPHTNRPDPERPLRLGFASADFGRHPVGLFLIRALEALDREMFCVFCYSDQANQDDIATRFRVMATAWRDIQGKSDEAVAKQIVDDSIDMMFDLSGHTAGTRLLALARKPAPVQVSWIGYEGTTGVSAIDALVADYHVAPEGVEPDYPERLIRLPDSYVCFEPPGDAPSVGPLPATGAGYITFGSFNNPAKVTPQVVSVWSEILRRLPHSRLVLKYRGFDDPGTRRRLLELFAAYEVDTARLQLLPHTPPSDMFAQYQRIDIGLDPFPFSGGLTTCLALWMGVPVVTWPGDTFASRHGLSFLATIGLRRLVATDRADYIERVVTLASDRTGLADLRRELRERMAASPLCDGARFAANLMPKLRQLWRDWCERPLCSPKLRS